MRRTVYVGLLLLACSPAVPSNGGSESSGGSSSETADPLTGGVTLTPPGGTLPGTGTLSTGPLSTGGSTDGGATSESSTGPTYEVIEAEGVVRPFPDSVKTQQYFELCGGEPITLVPSPGVELPLNCPGAYVRIVGHFAPYNIDGDALFVDELLENRACLPTDCGGTSCDELACARECDAAEQECPPDQRCVPSSSSGSGFYDTTRCVPLSDRPVVDGQACSAQLEFPWDDDCGLGSLCIGEDANGQDGTCIPLCTISAGDFVCPDETICVGPALNNAPLCLAPCDPFGASCPADQTCSLLAGGSACVPDRELPRLFPGACGETGACGPTEGCVPQAELVDCTESRCCAVWCDLADPTCPTGHECHASVFGPDSAGLCLAP